eukprot:79626_1
MACQTLPNHFNKPKSKSKCAYRTKTNRRRSKLVGYRTKTNKRRRSNIKPTNTLNTHLIHNTNNVISNNKSTLNSTSLTTENTLISAYFHEYINNNNTKTLLIPKHIINIIIKFLDLMGLYFSSSCTKLPHSNLGRIYKMP